jgi:asparagine synthase (glutamine-hydrolysing)
MPEIGDGPPRALADRDLDPLVEALVDSLRHRLIADVPLALFLSAGIDSSLVAALCRHEVHRELECLTVSFRGAEVRDESVAAQKIAQHLGFPHRILASDTSVPVRRLPELLGQPSGAVGALPLEQICAVARAAGFKAALTGMGGDEVTSGYAKNAFLWRMRSLSRAPRGLRRGTAEVLRRLSARLEGVAGLISADSTETYLAVKNYPALFWLRTLPGYLQLTATEFGNDHVPPEIAVPRYELTRVMPAVHLYTADHASMRHGVELRTPFLSRRVVEVIAKWDPRSLVAFGQKSILRRILARYIPPALTDYPKAGFSFPRQQLLAGDMPRNLPGLENRSMEACWRNRERGGGWAAIAVRMRTAEWFFKNG